MNNGRENGEGSQGVMSAVVVMLLLSLAMVVTWRISQGYSLGDLVKSPSLLYDGVISTRN